jgi:hypothetical protein
MLESWLLTHCSLATTIGLSLVVGVVISCLTISVTLGEASIMRTRPLSTFTCRRRSAFLIPVTGQSGSAAADD